MTDETKPAVDITTPSVFGFLALICIGFGLVLGYGCAWLFYEVSHPVIWQGKRALATQISPVHGAMMILIMAATGLMIALTMAYVPRWVIEYHDQGKMPHWVLKVYNLILSISDKMKEKI